MGDDLGAKRGEVHDEAARVLHFWFEELSEEQHWVKSITLDEAIAERFGPLRLKVVESAAWGWRITPHTLLAAIILIDQFSRNMFRDEGAAFEYDGLARELTLYGLLRGFDRNLPAERCAFLYMPLMHAEDPELQRLSIERFTALGDEQNLGFAHDHSAVIERFGRFPSRNRVLGRRSTVIEREYLSQPGVGW
jgi:uncharacterized protein (DUF924 family)